MSTKEQEKALENAEVDIIKMAAEIGAKTALDYINKENKAARETRYDRRLRNTRLLLSNYRDLKEHIKYAVYDAKQIIERGESAIDVFDLMWEGNKNPDAFVESIKRSVERTVIIMNHIDDMLEAYKYICERSNKEADLRRWNIINSLYLNENPKSIDEIAKDEYVDRRTVYRDIEIATEKISALIFGIDGLTKN